MLKKIHLQENKFFKSSALPGVEFFNLHWIIHYNSFRSDKRLSSSPSYEEEKTSQLVHLNSM